MSNPSNKAISQRLFRALNQKRLSPNLDTLLEDEDFQRSTISPFPDERPKTITKQKLMEQIDNKIAEIRERSSLLEKQE